MRIAVSGTHCSGKTTLVHDFLASHPEYIHEPEPYEWLEDVYGETLPAEPGVDDFYRQLELSVERLRGYQPGVAVIAERSPIDFIAYIRALTDLERAGRDCELIASAAELAAVGLAHVDVLAVLPLSARDGIVAPEDEDLELRDAMNERLLDIISTDEYGLFSSRHPRVVEVFGSGDQRLRMLEQAMVTLLR